MGHEVYSLLDIILRIYVRIKRQLFHNTKRDEDDTKASYTMTYRKSRRFDLHCKTSESRSLHPMDEEVVSRNAGSINSLGISNYSDSKTGHLADRNDVLSSSDSLKRLPRNEYPSSRQTVLPQISSASRSTDASSLQPPRQRTTFGAATNNKDPYGEGTTSGDKKSNAGRKKIEGEYVK